MTHSQGKISDLIIPSDICLEQVSITIYLGKYMHLFFFEIATVTALFEQLNFSQIFISN